MRSNLQFLINLLQGGLGGIPNTSMSRTHMGDRAVNSAQVLTFTYLYIVTEIFRIANYYFQTNHISSSFSFVGHVHKIIGMSNFD